MLRNPAFHLVLAPTRFLDLPCIHNANFYLFPGLTSLSSEMGAPFPMNVLLRLTFYSIVLYMITVSAFNSQVIPPSSFVKELNVWTFRGSIGDGRLWFVQFYVPWCRGCKRMVQQYDALASSFLNNPDIMIARFDCMQDEDYCERLGIDRTPTLKLYFKGQAVQTYKADFYLMELMEPFLKRMYDKYIRKVESSEVPAKLSSPATVEGSNAGEDRLPTSPSEDDAAGQRANKAQTDINGGDGGGSRPDDTIPATSVQPNIYRATGELAALEGMGSGSGHLTGLDETVTGNPPGEVVRATMTASAVSGCGGDAEGRGGGRCGGDSSSGSRDGEPLTHRGRHGGLAVETLQREKEEL